MQILIVDFADCLAGCFGEAPDLGDELVNLQAGLTEALFAHDLGRHF